MLRGPGRRKIEVISSHNILLKALTLDVWLEYDNDDDDDDAGPGGDAQAASSRAGAPSPPPPPSGVVGAHSCASACIKEWGGGGTAERRSRKVIWGPGGIDPSVRGQHGGHSVTLVVAAIDGKRPYHYGKYTGENPAFEADYLVSLKETLKLQHPMVVFMEDRHVEAVWPFMNRCVPIVLYQHT